MLMLIPMITTMLIMITMTMIQVRVKREESKGDLETKLNVVDNEERRSDHNSIIIILLSLL